MRIKRALFAVSTQYYFLAVILSYLLTAPFAQADDAVPPNAFAEWEPVQKVLMHTPGEELFLGVSHYEAALFDDTFDMDKAVEEHQAYIAALKQTGATVYTVTEVLLNSNRDDLIKLAQKATQLDATKLNPTDRREQIHCFKATFNRIPSKILVRMILQRPTIRLSYARKASQRNYVLPECRKYYVKADYALHPVMNLYFIRDQMITTAKGVVLNRMKLPQRSIETEIMDFVLKQLGIKTIYRIKGKNASLEGGDFIPAGERVYIGQGMRTNSAAIKELLANDAFGGKFQGVKEVVVVKDRWNNQQEMHLDTHFNVINNKLVVAVADRVDCKRNKAKCLKADVYKWEGRWRLADKDRDFTDYLMHTVAATIIPVSVEDQQRYGINFLTITKNEIIGVDGVSDEYKRALEQAGVKAKWIDFTNMKLGFGAAHCTTQVLLRKHDNRSEILK